ncbi:hypothetical protein B296_00012737 [Ensete ventricosum]|uniref:RRM domain-containing protein n=1 Tax=Ensete ventricosum TaxID=4639 RepID=A0A426YVG9_ENSVE|nr:hypothetical protein B296_00012737 [Ensete ventricosum]
MRGSKDEEMEEEEHEVYGGDIPDEADMDADVDIGRSDEDAAKLQELDEMKKRLKEMEEEAAALREIQAKVEKEMGAAQGPISSPMSNNGRRYTSPIASSLLPRIVGCWEVDYACTPEEVQQHFQSCGTVNRVTILTDKFGQPKGFAYVEFLELEAVQDALQLNESELHGRQIKVCLDSI